jgi:hypothetical protein
LGGRGCQHVGRAIPADVSQTLEFVSDARDGSRDDSPIERYEEEREEVGYHNQPELESLGLVEVIIKGMRVFLGVGGFGFGFGFGGQVFAIGGVVKLALLLHLHYVSGVIDVDLCCLFAVATSHGSCRARHDRNEKLKSRLKGLEALVIVETGSLKEMEGETEILLDR